MDIPAKILWSLSLVCGVEIDASRLVVGFFAEFFLVAQVYFSLNLMKQFENLDYFLKDIK